MCLFSCVNIKQHIHFVILIPSMCGKSSKKKKKLVLKLLFVSFIAVLIARHVLDFSTVHCGAVLFYKVLSCCEFGLKLQTKGKEWIAFHGVHCRWFALAWGLVLLAWSCSCLFSSGGCPSGRNRQFWRADTGRKRRNRSTHCLEIYSFPREGCSLREEEGVSSHWICSERNNEEGNIALADHTDASQLTRYS